MLRIEQENQKYLKKKKEK